MEKFEVILALEAVGEARSEFAKRQASFAANVETLMTRLLHEAARNMMSAEQVAKATGLTPKRVRALMRQSGLDPKMGKRLLASAAAEALHANAALLSVEPREIDLMSPLAYLPMGDDLKRFLETPSVTEIPEDNPLAGLIENLRALTYASDDGTEHEHTPDCQGEDTCPACWAQSIRRLITKAESA